jgi:RIO kinase 1
MPHRVAIPATADFQDYLDDFEDLYENRGRERMTRRRPKSGSAAAGALLASAGDNSEDAFRPSFSGSKHEREWIVNYLAPFHRDHQIVDVLRQVKGGKEATVYCCAAHPDTGLDLIAAKVYRPRMFRNLRNDAQYRQGREIIASDGKPIRERRALKAVQQGTRFGQQVSHMSWLSHEYITMTLLHEAGADVPKPLALSDNAILMEYVGAADMPAPTLNRVTLPEEEAVPLFRRLMDNVALMLAHDRVHGDLSAYNVLYWEGEVTIIDFPQVIDAYANRDAFSLLLRDVERLCQYFARYGIESDPLAITRDFWSRSMHDDTYLTRVSKW